MKEHLNAIILSVAIVVACLIYVFGTRYESASSSEAHAIVDRFTGYVFWQRRP